MKPILFALSFLLALPVYAQQGPESLPPYPQDYFRNPLDIPIFLAGNFGECRPGHFHSGVDIKTLGKENQPVHAAADGYISRIKMEKGGFGHGIYITHNNGYTTLYAHLNKFAPAIQEYVVAQQYSQKHWDVDLQLPPGMFPVKKGEQIAWSGNTGASTAPHLHFEIRNTRTEHPLNPELFGLPIIDNIAPVPAEVAIYNLGESIYEQEPLILPLKKDNGKYTVGKSNNTGYHVSGDTVVTDAKTIGMGLNIDDFMDGSDNTIAFLTAQLYFDDSLQCAVKLDNIGYDETRYINAYADYKTKELKHKWIQCLFKLPGNHLDSIYTFLNNNKGGIDIKGGLDIGEVHAHEARILVTDDKGNNSTVLLYIKSVNRPPQPDIHASGTKFSAGKQNDFTDPNVSFSLDSRQLYDDVYFVFAKTPDANAYSDKYRLHYAYVPVHHYFELRMKPNKTIPFGLRSKVAMLYSDDKEQDGRAATFGESGWYEAKVRSFGTYWLAIDTIPPAIKSLQKNNANLAKAEQITFEVRDNMTSVKKFSGYLDGKWLSFEQHENLFFYKFDGHCPKGKHSLVFSAEDENGNARSYHLEFMR